MNTVINVDVQGSKDNFDVWITHDGSSGCHYANVDLDEFGEIMVDYINDPDEHETGERHPKKKASEYCISNRQQCNDFVCEIVDIFEDFLENRDIMLKNPEKEYGDQDPWKVANIYGTDYGELQTRIEDCLEKWNIASKEALEAI